MKWNAFLIIRNEEEFIHEVIRRIKHQEPTPPEKIFVVQDGSTDNTGKILNDIGGLDVEHISSHPPSLGAEFWVKQNRVMRRAEKDVDYILCMNGDTHIQKSYVHDIIVRMEQDGVVAAHGFDKSEPFHTLVESGMITKTDWLRKYKVVYPAINVIICASVTGMRTAVYYDVEIRYIRKTGTHHNKELYELKGKHWKALGHSVIFVLYQSMRLRNIHCLRGYLNAAPCKKNEFTEWVKKWERDIARNKFFLKRKMSKITPSANFIEPCEPDRNKHRNDYGVWKIENTDNKI